MLKRNLQIISHYRRNSISTESGDPFVILGRCFSGQKTAPPAYKQELSYIHHIGKEPLVYRTVGQELEYAASKYGSTEAIVSCHEKRRYTFRSLIEDVDRLAAGFLKLGLQPGDHVGLWAPNYLHWYLSMLGAARAGLISVGINPAFQAPELEYCLKKVNIKALVAPLSYKTQNYYEIVKSICPQISDVEGDGRIKCDRLPHLQRLIIDTSEKRKGAINFDDLLGLSSTDEQQKIFAMQNSIVPDSPCNIQFTSGTTGHPKAAVLSHYNFVNNGIHIGERNQLAGQRICVQVPLFHAFGVVITTMAGICHGATLVLPAAGFSPEHSLRAIIDEKCTVIHGTPTMYVDLTKKQMELKLPLETAKMAITGGAICSPQLFLNIKKILGVEHVRTVFGLTESTAVIFQSRDGDSMDKIQHTVGHLVDHVEAKVVDAEGKTVPFGQPGELYVRGYVTMLEYFGDPDKTKATIDNDKWLQTGDQFVLHEDGYGEIVGRLKDMIIRGGENIFPKEVEDFLNTNPKILETHVIGVADERMGEELCAFARLHDGETNLTRDEVKQFCKGKLAHFKVPRYLILVKDFPKTTSGKIQKFKLQEIFKQQNVSK